MSFAQKTDCKVYLLTPPNLQRFLQCQPQPFHLDGAEFVFKRV